MNEGLFILVLVLICLVCIASGKKVARQIQNQEDYFLSSRQVKIPSLCLTLLATQLGGGSIIGSAEAAYTHGWYGLYYTLGIALGLGVLALGAGARLRKLNLQTVSQIFTAVYRSDSLQTLSSCISMVSLFFILLATGVAARKYFTALGLENELLFLLFWGGVVFYTVTGGLRAVILTDVIQISFVLGVFLITFLWIVGSPDIPELTSSPFSTNTSIPWTSWLLIPMLFTIVGQDMGQRCLAAKSSKAISIAAALAGVLLVLCGLLPTYLGIIAAHLHIPSASEKSVLMEVLLHLTNPYLTSLFACALLMAVMSTADSLLCAVSTHLVLDFKKIWPRNDSSSMKVAKGVTFFIGMGALSLSYWACEVIPIMVGAYELYVAMFFVPLVMGLFIRNPSKKAAYLAIAVGLTGFILGKTIFSSHAFMELTSLSAALGCFLMCHWVEKNRQVYSSV